MVTPLDAVRRAALIRHATDEVLTEERLAEYLERDLPLRHYIGLEISGLIHLGTGLMCMGKVADLQRAGVECRVFLADWHSWINEKLTGSLDDIRIAAVGYFRHGLAAALRCCGGDPDRVTWQLGSDLYARGNSYWETLVDVAKNTTLTRIQRSITIMGRKEGGTVDFAKLLYPVMQVADIFAQGVTLAHAGTDQRKAHVIAIDVAEQLVRQPLRDANGASIKPLAIHHPLILGLGKPPRLEPGQELKDVLSELKMSKSKPQSAVFIHDDPEAIRSKLRKAYCLEGDLSFNPVVDWAEKLLFRREGFILQVSRPAQHGGDVRYESAAALREAFAARALHPTDLKVAVAEALIDVLAPARAAFAAADGAKLLGEMQELLARSAAMGGR
jgi:tyrosyl-tRNA synthetase